MKHGYGKWRSNLDINNCNIYEGKYKNDLKDGLGKFTWASGNVYIGRFINDERIG
jgi:hypothetical protein